MTAPELKPCPFCGAAAEYSVTSDEGQRNDYDTVACSVCPSEMRRMLHWADEGGEGKDYLFSAWNRRADLAAVPAQVEPDCCDICRGKTFAETADGKGWRCVECKAIWLREPQPDPRDAVPAQVRVKRGGKWIVVDGKAYDLRDCTDRAAKIVQDSGSNNLGFDMLPWFFTGSPYADQIVALGATAQPVPDDFIAEYIPDLGKVWRSRQTIWETYIRTADPQPDTRDEVIARLVEALVEALVDMIDHADEISSPLVEARAALAAAKAVQHD